MRMRAAFHLPLVLLVSVSWSAASLAQDGGWRLIQVPGTWERQHRELADYDGFAWYRCYVKVPDRWASAQRDLWVQSVTVIVEYVADAYEVYLNGRRIGSSGRFPPRFEPADEGQQRYKVPPGVLKPGVYNTIAIRIYNHDGEGGFKGAAPILAGYHNEISLKGKWEFRAGDDPSWAIGPRADRPAAAAYDKVRPAISLLKIPTRWIPGRRVPPAESLRLLRTPEDLAVDQLLTEPLVAQPLSLTFDERARLWVVQYRQYPYPAGLRMVSRDHYYRAVYDRVPRPAPYGPPGADVVSIHQDTDGDGTFDRHKTFLTRLNLATSVTFGYGGVWVLNPPYLLFYPDRDRDDVPDSDPEVHLMGFGMEDTHSVANSIEWGPDGWIYGAHGSTVSSRIRVVRRRASARWFEQLPKDQEETYIEGAAIWRYDPRSGRFEVYAEGGGNAFGIYIDSKGRVFSGYNGGRTRGFYYIQGAYYVKESPGKYGPPSNPYAFGYLPAIKSHSNVPRFSHVFILYESTELPARYHGRLFAVDPLHQRVVASRIAPWGANFQTWDERFPLDGSKDVGFRPVELVAGPDGAIYVADFYEEFIAHGQHYQGQIDKNSGRIYRIRPRTDRWALPTNLDLARLSSEELLRLLTHHNVWYRRMALRLLAERGDRSVLEPLYKMLRAGDGQAALEAFWAINLLGGFDETLARETLQHPDPFVRLWTVRLLGDRDHVSAQMAHALGQLARKEPHPEVRAQLAATAKRLDVDACLAIVRGLVEHAEDVDDPFLPHLVYWALEKHAAEHVAELVEFFREKALWKLPFVRECLLERIMRRFAAEGQRRQLLACARLLEMAPDREAVDKLLAGFEAAFRGRSLAALPEELVSALAESGGGSLALRVRMKNPEAIAQALRMLRDRSLAAEQRAQLAEVLGEIGWKAAVPELLHVIRSEQDERLLTAALIALQRFDDERIARTILERYAALPVAARQVAQSVLVSRPSWARLFLAAIEKATIDRADVDPDTVNRLLIVPDEEVQRLVRKLWPGAGAVGGQQLQRAMTRVLQAAQQPGGDPYNGRRVFLNVCGKCHKLFGEGGVVGPDLTTYERRDTQRLALQIVNPSLEIREGFEPYAILTTDGRILVGIIQDRDERLILLRTSDGALVTVRRDEIEELVRQPKSIMPEGLLDSLTDEQIRDLFTYLRAGQPVR